MKNKPLRVISFIPVLMLSIFLSGSVQAHTPGLELMLWPSLALDATGVPYVAFSDETQGNKLSVMKFEKGAWVSAGSPGLSSGTSLMPSLALTNAGVVTVAFWDSGYGGAVLPLVKKFERGAWVSVDQLGTLRRKDWRLALEKGEILVPDHSGRNGTQALVLNASGQPYMVMNRLEKTTGSKLVVAKFEGGDWVPESSLDISPEGRTLPSSMTFDADGGVWVAFTDPEHDYKLSVKRRKGNTWVSIGQLGFTPDKAGFPSLKISSAGVPFVAFQDVEKNGTFSVMKFEKGAWVYVGEAGFSSGGILPSLAISKEGVPFLAYMEYGHTNEGKLVVMKLEGENWIKVESQESASVSKSCQSETLDRSTLYTRKQCQRAAEQGDAQAQYYVGRMYAGYGVARDDKEALKWIRKSAEQGYAGAQYDLGITYIRGESVERNDAEAAKWIRKAAEQGLKGAQSLLARMYAQGQGVAKDEAQAEKWRKKASEQGSPDAK